MTHVRARERAQKIPGCLPGINKSDWGEPELLFVAPAMLKRQKSKETDESRG